MFRSQKHRKTWNIKKGETYQRDLIHNRSKTGRKEEAKPHISPELPLVYGVSKERWATMKEKNLNLKHTDKDRGTFSCGETERPDRVLAKKTAMTFKAE